MTGLLASTTDARVDLISSDDGLAVLVKSELTSVRDLHAAALQLAFYVAEVGLIRDRLRGIILAHAPRVTARRMEAEWEKLGRVLDPPLVRRLGLVAFCADGEVALPPFDEQVKRLATAARPLITAAKRDVARTEVRWDRKRLEVWKVLFDAWLRNEPPLLIGELARRAGASHPTVASTLDRLELRREVQRTSSRRAVLTGPPRRSLAELVVLAPQLRRTSSLVDSSGRAPDMEDLLARLTKSALPGVQIGGVAAARHHQPSFNLNGLPRVDVTVDRRVPAGWWRQIDPALTLAGADAPSPVLVIHQTLRPPDDGERFASPAETVLDLHALRLEEQAEDLVRFLRQK